MAPFRFLFVLCCVIALVSGVAATSSTARGDSGSRIASLGYPELEIEITDTHVVAPSTFPAGRAAVTVRNTGSQSNRVSLMRVLNEEERDGAPTGNIDFGQMWLARDTFPGFPGVVPPGEAGFAVVDLLPGVYGLYYGSSPNILIVTSPESADESPSTAADPEPAVKILLFDHFYQFPASIVSGDQIWEVVNLGGQPHELTLFAVADGATRGDLLAHLDAESLPGTPVGGLDMLSTGGTAWMEVDLDPGTYAVFCFVVDPATDRFHAMEGPLTRNATFDA